METAVVDDSMVLLLLAALCQVKQPMASLYSGSSCRFRKVWAWGINGILFCSKAYLPYAIRRGGATDDWARYQDTGRLLMRGRWGSFTTAKIYAVEGLRVRDQSSVIGDQRERPNYWGGVLSVNLDGLQEQIGRSCVPHSLYLFNFSFGSLGTSGKSYEGQLTSHDLATKQPLAGISGEVPLPQEVSKQDTQI